MKEFDNRNELNLLGNGMRREVYNSRSGLTDSEKWERDNRELDASENLSAHDSDGERAYLCLLRTLSNESILILSTVGAEIVGTILWERLDKLKRIQQLY